ncbi:hypothetical protein TREMEDRAFT_64959 [Tremella mesenterica DSM 1558]|uniref:uncharacterized protein n=1 Tax=Tremella mesenterica (strain ATCC 24925 / CBS 8224 / DSM 1558 / NBRC 9311 / NRRL Y-6157 / RJB 2259-6 / UBC 559-6) TaxID=578456 RepID=UPI0003F4A236|nr:uncharacterized protein TREMEDRAFT_64959 [Tremella mesenterica DSM 1558]EIW67090.1 hypothetical protein TREMEDRAFT_64959 [Tremella mesenterica DSM 1558]
MIDLDLTFLIERSTSLSFVIPLILLLITHSVPRHLTSLQTKNIPSPASISLMICTIIRALLPILDTQTHFAIVQELGRASLFCRVDAVLEAFFSTALIAHLPVVIYTYNHSFPTSTNPNPSSPRLYLLLIPWVYALIPTTPLLIDTLLHPSLHVWWGYYCHSPSSWWRFIIGWSATWWPRAVEVVSAPLVFIAYGSNSEIWMTWWAWIRFRHPQTPASTSTSPSTPSTPSYPEMSTDTWDPEVISKISDGQWRRSTRKSIMRQEEQPRKYTNPKSKRITIQDEPTKSKRVKRKDNTKSNLNRSSSFFSGPPILIPQTGLKPFQPPLSQDSIGPERLWFGDFLDQRESSRSLHIPQESVYPMKMDNFSHFTQDDTNGLREMRRTGTPMVISSQQIPDQNRPHGYRLTIRNSTPSPLPPPTITLTSENSQSSSSQGGSQEAGALRGLGRLDSVKRSERNDTVDMSDQSGIKRLRIGRQSGQDDKLEGENDERLNPSYSPPFTYSLALTESTSNTFGPPLTTNITSSGEIPINHPRNLILNSDSIVNIQPTYLSVNPDTLGNNPNNQSRSLTSTPNAQNSHLDIYSKPPKYQFRQSGISVNASIISDLSQYSQSSLAPANKISSNSHDGDQAIPGSYTKNETTLEQKTVISSRNDTEVFEEIRREDDQVGEELLPPRYGKYEGSEVSYATGGTFGLIRGTSGRDDGGRSTSFRDRSGRF